MNNREIYRKRRSKRRRKTSRLTKGVMSTVVVFATLLVIMLASGQAFTETKPDLGDSIDSGCLMDVIVPDDVEEEIIDYTGFRISFNASHHVPNYAIWELTGEETLGTTPRKSKFKTDKRVYGCANTDDYRNSGFDRGHMAPAGDMKWNDDAMDDSHYMTNIVPQDHTINGGRWSTLEKKCREWAVRDSAIIVVCGPVLSDVITRQIGMSKVTVPERFFKVVLAPYTNPPRAIGFIMPNSPTNDGLEALATSVDNIEAITGYDFFSCLPDDIEGQVECSSNYRVWNRKER